MDAKSFMIKRYKLDIGGENLNTTHCNFSGTKAIKQKKFSSKTKKNFKVSKLNKIPRLPYIAWIT